MIDRADVIAICGRFPGADAVFLLAPFNNWSTAATPLARHEQDLWEVRLPANVQLTGYRFFVWDQRAHAGHITRN